MTTTSKAMSTTYVEALWARDITWVRGCLLALLGSFALTLSAKLQIPFYPVPMTMQTFMVLTIGMFYGWRLGSLTVALYLAQGAFGLPVFAGTPEKGMGLAYMAGPTGGYLLGFVAAATTVGWLSRKGWDRKVWSTLLAMALGSTIIFVCGVLWLAAVIGWDKPVFQLGVIPFLPGELFKICLAAGLLPLLWRLLDRPKKEG